VQCGTGQQDFQTVLLARIAAGDPPDATVYWDTPVPLALRGALVPLDDLMAQSQHAQTKNWPASALASCEWGGKTWGLPVTAGPYAMWLHGEWFAKKGISTKRQDFPKTWDDLRKLSKEFTYWKGDHLVSAGYVPMWSPAATEMTATIYVWSALNGGSLYDAQKRAYTIDAESNVAMMEYMLSWLNEEYKGDMSAVDRSGNWYGYVDANGRPPAFQAGKMAMLEEGFWFLGGMYNSPPTVEDYEVAPYPAGPGGTKTVSGTWPNWLVIPHGSPHVQQAFEWLDYLASSGIRLWFTFVADMPSNKTVPYLLPTLAVQKRGTPFAQDATRFFHHQLDISIPMWNSPVQTFATDQILKAVDRIMHKVVKPKEALAEAQQACQNQLNATLRSAH
jgi:ABC-type glycerol-3-phosphate transport system substrate-binding protein